MKDCQLVSIESTDHSKEEMMKRISLCLAAALTFTLQAAESKNEPKAAALPGRAETNVVIKIKGGDEFRMTYPG